MNWEDTAKKIAEMIHKGEIAPWKAEQAALKEGVSVPENIAAAAKARRLFIEEKSGHQFHHIVLPQKPYQITCRCPNDGTLWTLAADDTYVCCGLCGTPLDLAEEEKRYCPLVNNYIGGVEDYYSYAGEATVGGEIIPAFYRTMKNNPRPYLVSCYQKLYVETRGDDVIFGVELPNVEVGITSSPEGIISPMAREALRFAGIHSAKEYTAAAAAIILAGEYNFTTLHIMEKMYTGR